MRSRPPACSPGRTRGSTYTAPSGCRRRARRRHPTRALQCAESRRAGAADVRPQREGGDAAVRQVCPRGRRENAARAPADGPPAIVPAPRRAPTEASRWWAEALRRRCCRRSSTAPPSRAPPATASWALSRASRPPADAPMSPCVWPPHAPRSRGDGRRARSSHRGVTTRPAGPETSTGPGAEEPARDTSTAADGPSPADRCLRGRGPGTILSPPRLRFLSRACVLSRSRGRPDADDLD